MASLFSLKGLTQACAFHCLGLGGDMYAEQGNTFLCALCFLFWQLDAEVRTGSGLITLARLHVGGTSSHHGAQNA
jgi:hypothetical protein